MFGCWRISLISMLLWRWKETNKSFLLITNCACVGNRNVDILCNLVPARNETMPIIIGKIWLVITSISIKIEFFEKSTQFNSFKQKQKKTRHRFIFQNTVWYITRHSHYIKRITQPILRKFIKRQEKLTQELLRISTPDPRIHQKFTENNEFRDTFQNWTTHPHKAHQLHRPINHNFQRTHVSFPPTKRAKQRRSIVDIVGARCVNDLAGWGPPGAQGLGLLRHDAHASPTRPHPS